MENIVVIEGRDRLDFTFEVFSGRLARHVVFQHFDCDLDQTVSAQRTVEFPCNAQMSRLTEFSAVSLL